MNRFICGTPENECDGTTTKLSTPWPIGASTKSHSSSTGAFKCHMRYLLNNGYKRVGSREVETKDGTVRVLTKKIRFGGRLRLGKEGRWMCKHRYNGTIISK